MKSINVSDVLGAVDDATAGAIEQPSRTSRRALVRKSQGSSFSLREDIGRDDSAIAFFSSGFDGDLGVNSCEFLVELQIKASRKSTGTLPGNVRTTRRGAPLRPALSVFL